jgi:hypothetical protein
MQELYRKLERRCRKLERTSTSRNRNIKYVPSTTWEEKEEEEEEMEMGNT